MRSLDRPVLLLVALLLGGLASASLARPAAPDRSVADADPLDPGHHEIAARYSAACSGLSMLVFVKGELVYESYANGVRNIEKYTQQPLTQNPLDFANHIEPFQPSDDFI